MVLNAKLNVYINYSINLPRQMWWLAAYLTRKEGKVI